MSGWAVNTERSKVKVRRRGFFTKTAKVLLLLFELHWHMTLSIWSILRKQCNQLISAMYIFRLFASHQFLSEINAQTKEWPADNHWLSDHLHRDNELLGPHTHDPEASALSWPTDQPTIRPSDQRKRSDDATWSYILRGYTHIWPLGRRGVGLNGIWTLLTFNLGLSLCFFTLLRYYIIVGQLIIWWPCYI